MSTVLETPVPRPVRVATGPTLIATAAPGRGLLQKLASVLSVHPVEDLAVRTPASGPVTVEITVPDAHVARVRAKLLRMVDVLDVLDVIDGRILEGTSDQGGASRS